MRRLNHLGRASREERGVSAIIVAISTTVIFGMAAFVIDAGAIYQERRELQNGADAGALAVAEDCAMGDCGNYMGTATGLAGGNANDSASTVDGVSIDMSARTAKVDVSTSDPSGGSKIAYQFAQIFDKDGTTVHATATAQWGPVGNAPSVPLVISWCEWSRAVGNPQNLPSSQLTLSFHDGGSAEPCNGPAGKDVPGGFGWLDSDDCEANLDVVDGYVWAGSDPGSAPPNDCSPADFEIGEKILIPVFDLTSGQGQGAQFRLVGFAGFRITGIKLLQGNPFWTEGAACILPVAPAPPGNGQGNKGQDQACITGNFEEYFVADAQLGGPNVPDLGSRTVQLIA